MHIVWVFWCHDTIHIRMHNLSFLRVSVSSVCVCVSVCIVSVWSKKLTLDNWSISQYTVKCKSTRQFVCYFSSFCCFYYIFFCCCCCRNALLIRGNWAIRRHSKDVVRHESHPSFSINIRINIFLYFNFYHYVYVYGYCLCYLYYYTYIWFI